MLIMMDLFNLFHKTLILPSQISMYLHFTSKAMRITAIFRSIFKLNFNRYTCSNKKSKGSIQSLR